MKMREHHPVSHEQRVYVLMCLNMGTRLLIPFSNVPRGYFPCVENENVYRNQRLINHMVCIM